MLRTKKDVEKHVHDLLKKVGNETERKLLGFNFAKLYYQIGEYKLARQHLVSYLAVKECSAPGHRLAGQISEALGEKEAAVRSYKRSFDLDSTQKDLVFKICTLVCELPSTPANRDLQQCWLERAEALQPQHSVVFELKQRLMLSSSDVSKGKVEDDLKNEVLTKPADMKLRIHLLRLYLDSNRVKEAFDHMVKIESLQVFGSEPEWYVCSLDVLNAIKNANIKLGADYYFHLLNAIERLAFSRISRVGQGHKSGQAVGDVVSIILRLDDALQQAAANGTSRDVVRHFACQLYFFIGLVALLKARAGLEEEQQALSYATTLFAIAYNQEAISAGNRSPSDKKLVESWVLCATYRQSQCGHCIVAWESKEGRRWVVDTVKKWDNVDGKRRIFDAVLGRSGTFAETVDFAVVQLQLPSFADLLEVDKRAVQLNASELHHVVWLGLRYFVMHRRSDETDFAPDISQILMACRFIQDIPFSVASWNSCAPETLSALDIEAFVYTTIYSLVSMDEGFCDSKRIGTLPATLTKPLSTDQQSGWWQATFKLISGSAKENLGELRRNLQRGLEVVRLSGNQHGIPLELVAKLARTFMTRAGKARTFPPVDVPAPICTEVLTVDETEALEAQAGRYWKVFLEMASSGNRYTPPLSGRLFEFRSPGADIDHLIQLGKLFTGYQLWRSGKREEAQRHLQSTTDPYASYYQGLLFKEMAEEELRKGATVYESRSAANVLLNKAKDAFYITLDRLRSPGAERFHPLDQKLAEAIEKVESKLGSLTNLSVANGHTTDEEEESEEREFVTPQQITSTPQRRNLTNISSMRQNGTTIGSRLEASARVEARPSPERLDAQLRQMVHRQDEFNQAISNELKHIRAEVVDIKTLIQKLETHLEIQAKQEVKAKPKKSAEKGSETYEEGYDEDDVAGDWDGEEEEEEEETDLENLVRLKGKLKSSSQATPPVSLPLYPPPFAPAATRPPYGFPPTYGPPFHPSAYPQYPGFPGYMGGPSPVGAFPLTYPGYPTGMPHWDMQPGTASPGPFLPTGLVAQPPQIPATVPGAPAPSVFARLGTRDGTTPILASALQQPVAPVAPAVPIAPATAPAEVKEPIADTLSKTPTSGANTVHAYQIALPTQPSPEKVIDTKLVPPIQLPSQGILASIPEPQYSSVTTSPDKNVKPGRDRKVSSCSEGSYAPEEEVDNYPDFKPIIPLPEEVEVTTGEEGEEVLYDQRAKLFRLCDGEWKERGIGQLKLLQNPDTKKVRLIMRRDQVLKICANHFITADMKLTEMKAAANSWIWAAMDFADGEGKLEKFAARFKTPEIAAEFCQAFEKAKLSDADKSKPTKTPQVTKAVVETPKSTSSSGFGDKFAPKAGTWNCPSCYVNNTGDAVKCAACETAKPGTAAATFTQTAPAPAKFTFGMPAATPSQAPQVTSTASAITTPSSSAAPLTGFKFGVSPAASTSPIKFGIPAVATSAPSSSTSTTTPAFGVSKPSFSFTMPQSTAASTTTTKAPFTFSPPKLATTAAPKTNGQTELFGKPVTSTVSTAGAPVASVPSVPIFGSLGVSAAPAAATTPVSTPSIFGNVKPTAVAGDEKKPDVKPSPFANFSFTGLGSSSTKESGEKKIESGMLFSLLAQQTPSTGFTITPNKEFPGQGTPLFTSSSTKDKEKDKEHEDGEENEGEEYEPNVAFVPVVPLPALVELTSGEEDENVLFCDSAILYRFVQDSKEWKEKGRGDMKILEHKVTGKVRLLMRRYQVLKICCNHLITPQHSLKPLQSSDRTWTWFAQDFSDEEMVQEKFALKFKTSDQAQKFKQVFEEAQKKIAAATTEPAAGKEAVKSQRAATTATKPLSEMFKPTEGSWDCKGCYLRNNADVLKCPSCETPKPESKPPGVTTATKSLADLFSSPAPAASSTAPSVFKPATGFTFGSQPTGGFNFTTTGSPFKSTFGASSSTSTTAPASNLSGFTFTMSPPAVTSPVRPVGRSPRVSAGSDNEYYQEEADGDNIHFEPIIPLPEKIQVKTGEEDEEVLFCNRAKLFRFVDGEWKERGLGDIKILRHKDTKKTRLLMRREQILKTCLNHALSPALVFKPKDPRSWIWAAQDFTDGEGKLERFVVRFRDADIATSFVDIITKIQSGAPVEAKSTSEEDDMQLVYAKEATEEQKRKARELKLPLNFFLYENAPPCPGCRGCEPDDENEVKPAAVTKSDTSASKTTTPSMFGSASWMKTPESSQAPLSFSALASSAPVGFKKPETFLWSGTGAPVFGQSPLITSPTQQESKADEADAEDEGVPESNDPHFEPIIPLPALVDVKTGEEGLDVIFSHRAKLFRFDSSTKEWKEKGVGDIKILHVSEKNMYRILMRRDQIHKLACNHWLTTEMVLKPLMTSNTSWTWFAMDYSQGEIIREQLAVRFKTEDQAYLFRQKFEECQASLRDGAPRSDNSAPVEAAAAVPTKEAPAVVSASSEDNTDQAEEEEEEQEKGTEEEQDEDYEDVEESVMFEKRCTLSWLECSSGEKTWLLLGTGDLKIIYDDDMLCARIIVEGGNEQLLCDNVIAIETELKVDGKECIWSAIDYSSDECAQRTFRAQFSSTNAALEFQSIFAEAKQFAEKSDVHDKPDLYSAGYDHSNDDHGDDHGDYVEGKF